MPETENQVEIFIPKQELILKDDKYRITHFNFQRKGDKKIEKGQHFTFKAPESDAVRKIINDAMASETPLSVEIGEEKFGRLAIIFPSVAQQKGGFGGGGGGRPQLPAYRGRKHTRDEFKKLFFEIKTVLDDWNRKKYPALTDAELSELVRSEAAQWIIMIKDNVWGVD